MLLCAIFAQRHSLKSAVWLARHLSCVLMPTPTTQAAVKCTPPCELMRSYVIKCPAAAARRVIGALQQSGSRRHRGRCSSKLLVLVRPSQPAAGCVRAVVRSNTSTKIDAHPNPSCCVKRCVAWVAGRANWLIRSFLTCAAQTPSGRGNTAWHPSAGPSLQAARAPGG